MQTTIRQLEQIVIDYTAQLQQLSETELSFKPSPTKWSRKEVLGHLIDSAQTNIRRFVIAQYEDKPKIVYAQDNWVIAANYQNYHTADLIALWGLLNKHICIVLKNMPDGGEEKEVLTQELHTIEWLAADYNKHLLHHLHVLLNLEPVAYP